MAQTEFRVEQLPATTSVGTPGVDTLIPTEKAVRDALDAVGSGNVATDAIWDAKGDLAVGTGPNTAAKLTVGANGKVLMAASGEATGLKWETVAGTAGTVNTGGGGGASHNNLAGAAGGSGIVIIRYTI